SCPPFSAGSASSRPPGANETCRGERRFEPSLQQSKASLACALGCDESLELRFSGSDECRSGGGFAFGWLEEWSQRRRKLFRAGGSAKTPVPGMSVNAVQDTSCQGNRL